MLNQARVLFVDDEEFLLELLDAPLGKLCQSVEFCSSPLLALKVLKERGERFDILVSDFVMPEMLGTQLIAEAKLIHPDLAVILATGNSSYDLETFIEKQGWSRFSVLSKPYNIAQLEEALKQVWANI